MPKHKTKILVFCPLYPPLVGGLESHAEQFNQQLIKHDISICVFTPLSYAGGEVLEKTNNISIFRFPALEIIPNYHLPQFWRPLFWKMLRQAQQPKPQIIISRTRFFITSLLALAVTKTTHTPWLHIEHGSGYVHLNNPITRLLAKLYDHTFGALVLDMADKVVANSHASARFVKKLSPAVNASVIYRGVPKEMITTIPANTKIRQQYPNKTIITYIGRLIDGKGVANLLKALAQLSNNTFHCLIIGGGPQQDALVNLSRKLNIANQVTFLNRQNFSSTMSILKSSDIFVNPSYTEGLPTAVIEAALCSKAIVATNVGGTSEIITDNVSGYLIPPRRVDLLNQKLTVLVDDKSLREKLGQTAKREVESNFGWDVSLKKYERIFDELLK